MEISRYWIDEIVYMYDKGSDVDDICLMLMLVNEFYEEKVDFTLSEVVFIIQLRKEGYRVMDINAVFEIKSQEEKDLSLKFREREKEGNNDEF